MIYITQLIYIKPGQEAVFDEFEAVAIPIIAKHNGRLLFRLRPSEADFIECNMERPYEIHLTEVASEADLQNFMQDEERQRFLHLKEQSIRSAVLYRGEKIG
jgi:uncharacterized protein (DUF1330 family)